MRTDDYATGADVAAKTAGGASPSPTATGADVT